MGEANKVKLHGMWASPYVKRVELALKIKGIPFEYVEEDLQHKSEAVLKYNPIYKAVPILVHNNKPIIESVIIIDYIDQTWKNVGPPLLPQDPYKRARVRFWAHYLEQEFFETVNTVIKTSGEVQEKAIKKVFDGLKVLEDGIKEFFSDGASYASGETAGLLDIVMYALFGIHKAHEEVVGVKFIDSDKYPLVFSWVQTLCELAVEKDAAFPHDQMVAILQYVRQHGLLHPPSKD